MGRISSVEAADEFREELLEAIRVFEDLGDEAGLATAWTVVVPRLLPCRYEQGERAAGRAVETRAGAATGFLASTQDAAVYAWHTGDRHPGRGVSDTGRDARRRRPQSSTRGVRTRRPRLSYEARAGRSTKRESHRTRDRARGKFGILVGSRCTNRRSGKWNSWRMIRAQPSELRRSYEISDELGKRDRSRRLRIPLLTPVGLGRFDEAEGFATTAEASDEDDLVTGGRAIGSGLGADITRRIRRGRAARPGGRRDVRQEQSARRPRATR